MKSRRIRPSAPERCLSVMEICQNVARPMNRPPPTKPEGGWPPYPGSRVVELGRFLHGFEKATRGFRKVRSL